MLRQAVWVGIDVRVYTIVDRWMQMLDKAILAEHLGFKLTLGTSVAPARQSRDDVKLDVGCLQR